MRSPVKHQPRTALSVRRKSFDQFVEEKQPSPDDLSLTRDELNTVAGFVLCILIAVTVISFIGGLFVGAFLF